MEDELEAKRWEVANQMKMLGKRLEFPVLAVVAELRNSIENRQAGTRSTFYAAVVGFRIWCV